MFVSWDSFTETVREFLTVDGVRKGSLTQKYLARLIRAAALDLQAHVPSLKPHFRKEFPVEDLAKTKDNGMYVSSGEFSSSSTSVIAAHVISAKGKIRELERSPGVQSAKLPTRGVGQFQCGAISFTSCGFAVRPALKEGEILVIRYVSEVSDFQTNDRVPFDDRCAKMAAEFVKAHLSREIDKDLNLYKSYMEGYFRERAIYHLDRRDFLPDCLNDTQTVKYDSEQMSLESKILIAGEALFVGDLVTITPAGVQRATSLDPTMSCDGFVISDYDAGEESLVYFEGLVPGDTLDVGSRYYLSPSKGAVSLESPFTGISQFIGRAVSETEINFEPDQPSKL